MKDINLVYVEEIVEAFDNDKITSCSISTEIIDNDYGEKLTYTIVVENKSEPKTMEEFFEQRQGDFTFVEAYEFKKKLERESK